jgi:hypothetical protein
MHDGRIPRGGGWDVGRRPGAAVRCTKELVQVDLVGQDGDAALRSSRSTRLSGAASRRAWQRHDSRQQVRCDGHAGAAGRQRGDGDSALTHRRGSASRVWSNRPPRPAAHTASTGA